jgi:hypothetical protein
MPTNHDVWDAIVQEPGTPAASFEFLLDVFYSGAFQRNADIVNLNPAFTAKTRSRQTYAAKGVDNALKYGDNLVLTFDVEAVRDGNGLYQADLQDLINASKLNGTSNIRRMRVYDALGADYAFDADFSVSVTRTNTGFDEAAFFTVTATQYLFRGWIANPVLVGNIPLITNVTPSTTADAATVYIQGEAFTGVTGVTGVKFDGVNATSYVVQNDTLISAVVPVLAAGVRPVTVTHPTNGASAAYAGYTNT